VLAAIKSHTIFVPPHFGAHLLILMKCSSPAFSRKKKKYATTSVSHVVQRSVLFDGQLKEKRNSLRRFLEATVKESLLLLILG
jgi:hypothetical protein